MSKRMSIIDIYNIYIHNIYLKTKKIKRQVVNIYIILPIIILLSSSNNWDKTLKELTNGSYEYKACKLIIYKESSYNPKAKTGSHYGLPQGRSTYLKTATPQQQIKWFVKYVNSRYGSCQAALAFHLKNGYY